MPRKFPGGPKRHQEVPRRSQEACEFTVLEFVLTLEIWRSGVVNLLIVCNFVLEFALTLEIWRSGVVNLRNCLQLCARN